MNVLRQLVVPLTKMAIAAVMPLAVYGAASVDGQKLLATANNGFAFKLLKEISKEQPSKNIFISPYSAATVLQLTEMELKARQSRKCNVSWAQRVSQRRRQRSQPGLSHAP